MQSVENSKKEAITAEIQALLNDYLNAVVDADLDVFDGFISRDAYISYVGQGRIEPSREIRMEGIRAAFDMAKEAGTAGDQDALQQRETAIDVLSEDLVLVQISCFLRDANLRYGESVILKREAKGWEVIHSHASTATEE